MLFWGDAQPTFVRKALIDVAHFNCVWGEAPADFFLEML
jgi:hypothetical protein